MIDDLRKLKPGTLLIAREQLKFFVTQNDDDNREYEKKTIKKGEVVLYLDHDTEIAPFIDNDADNTSFQRDIKIKLLMKERVYWATISSIVESAQQLPEDLLDSSYSLPYFDEAMAKE